MTKLLDATNTMAVDRTVARDLLKRYREAKAPATDEDRAIMTAYREIARGRVVIQAMQAIRSAGWNEAGHPKLAISRADIQRCELSSERDSVTYSASRRGYWRARIVVRQMPQRPDIRGNWHAAAVVPLIPLHLRPKHDLKNYWILWEADWHAVPRDPLLLRRLKGDLWLVLAAWDLTEVERAVLSQRVNG